MLTQEGKIVSAIRSLGKSRYPNLLISQSTKQTLSDDAAKSIAQTAGLHYLDFREDVLPNQPEIKLGAYSRSEFQEWLNNTSKLRAGILLVNADVLISTWDEPIRKAFFKEYLLNGVNYGPSTVLVSWLGGNFDLKEIHNGEIKILKMDNLDYMGE